MTVDVAPLETTENQFLQSSRVKVSPEATPAEGISKEISIDVVDATSETNKDKEKCFTDDKTEEVKEIKPIEDDQKTIAVDKTLEQEKVALKTTPVESRSKDTEESKKKPHRKRAQSTSSNKSTKDETETKMEAKTEEPKTPMTRKRSQSNASNASVTKQEKTPENAETPSRRAKTPTTEVRKILTRRASKEMSDKMDESQLSLDDSVLTPRRRSTRSRSKNIDDNASVASESSVKSTRSKASEDVEVKPVRKGRKSVLSTKPDLSVIPEAIAEESKIDANEELINEYSSSRR